MVRVGTEGAASAAASGFALLPPANSSKAATIGNSNTPVTMNGSRNTANIVVALATNATTAPDTFASSGSAPS